GGNHQKGCSATRDTASSTSTAFISLSFPPTRPTRQNQLRALHPIAHMRSMRFPSVNFRNHLFRCPSLLRDGEQTQPGRAERGGRHYARLLLNEVRVDDREIRISGSKAVLARSATGGVAKTTPAVLSFVREWRTRQGCNNPMKSKPGKG